jgi:hypothetical protein
MLSSFWHHLLNRLGLQPTHARRQYQLDEEFEAIIVELAQQEHRSEDEVPTNLLASALAQRNAIEELWNFGSIPLLISGFRIYLCFDQSCDKSLVDNSESP